MHILLSGSTSQVVWHHLRASVFILSRLIGEKRTLTSGDLPGTSDRRLHPDLHREVSGHDTERIGWFLSFYAKREAFSYVSLGL